MKLAIRNATEQDMQTLVAIYAECFPREKQHETWVKANMFAFPRYLYCIVENEDVAIGYAGWTVKSGFRDKVVIELEQIGVLPQYAGKGVGKFLLNQSLENFRSHLLNLSISIKSIYVTTREGNFAEHLYTTQLGVKRQGVIQNYGSGNELILYGNV